MTTPKDARPPSETTSVVARSAPFERTRRRERRWWIFLAVFVPLVGAAWLTMLGVPRGTLVSPHGRVLVERGRSHAWAGTSQFAWDRLASKVGGKGLKVTGAADPSSIDVMNERPFPGAAFDSKSVIVLVGDLDDHPARRFLEALTDRYGSVPQGIEAKDPAEGHLGAWAYFRKDVAFSVPFPAVAHGIRFATGPMPLLGSTRVEAFGFPDGHGDPAAIRQVYVHWQDHPDHPERYVLELVPTGGLERVLLARIDPEETLERTWDVVARVAAKAGTPLSARPFRRLVIPVVSTGLLSAHFDPLLGSLPGGAKFSEYRQWIQFSLGGDATHAAGTSSSSSGSGPSYEFDEPFLVALAAKDATRASLLLWIANPDMLVRAR